jgi:hypothetical protein
MTTGALETGSFRKFAVSFRAVDQSAVRMLWLVSVALYIALATGTAMTRQPYGDEGELASPAYNLVHRGHLEVTQWEGARLSHKAYWMPPVYFFAQAGWQAVVGFGVIQSRLATVLWGLILLFSVGYLVQKITGNAVLASLVGFAVGTDYTYLMHAGVARCEIMSAALAILASAVYMLLRERSLSGAVFVSHALMTLSGLTHPVGGIMWMPCLLGLQLSLDRRRLVWKDYILGALPYLIGATAWGAYILQDPAEFRRQFFGISLSERRFAGLADPITALRRELGRFLGYYGVRPNASWAVRLKVLLPIGYVLGLLGALLIPAVRKQRFVKGCLLLLTVQLFILTFIEGTKQSHYIVDVIPTFVAILVVLWWSLYTSQPKLRSVFVAVGVIYVLAQVGPVLFRIRENPYRKDFLPTVETMRPFVERKLFVVSGPEFATPFNFPENVISRADYGFRSARTPDIIVTSVAQYERNTVVARNDPPLYRYMTVTFHQRFHLIFSSGDFAVYKRTS